MSTPDTTLLDAGKDLFYDLHRNPEPSWQEERTAGRVREFLASRGIAVLDSAVRPGLLVDIEGEKPGRRVLLRGDMDALPIREETDLPYRSMRDGWMHACGHDAHTTIAALVAARLHEQRSELAGTVRIAFQPAEEVDRSGARAMIEAGDADGCEAFLALHCDPLIPLGKIGYRRGHLNAAVDTVRITVRGKGGHGSRPHLCVDPVRIGSLLVTELHHLVGREVSAHDPTVLTITTFHAGDAANIIAETALLQGTLRSYDDTARKAMKEGIRRVCKGLGQAHRAGIDVEMGDGHPSVRNDDGLVSLLEESITETLGKDAHHVMPVPTLGGDDFAYFGRKGPQLLYRLGVRVDAKAPPEDLHSPRFVVPPEALEIGARVMEELARRVARG